MSNNKSINIRWFYLGVGVVSLFAAGIIYAWSIVKVPLADFGWEPAQLNLNYTIMLSCFCLGGMIPGLLRRFIHPKLIIIGAAILCFLGYLISSRMSGEYIAVLYLSYGVMAGLGIGAAYNAVLTMVNQWFPERRGLSGGVLMMSFGISTLVLGKATNALFQAENVGWRATYLGIGIMILVLLVIAGIVINPPAADAELPNPAQGKINNISARDYKPSEILKTSSFWRFFIVLVLMSSLGSGVISTGKELIMSIGASADAAVTIVGILAISNGVGRVLIGIIFDKIGFVRSKVLAGVANVLGAVFLLLGVLTSSVFAGVIGFILAGMSYGCCPTLQSFMCSAFYGVKYFSLNMAIINLHLLFSSFMATIVSSLCESTGGYVMPSVVILCCTVVAFIINLTIRKA